jgi:hypothetical protein
MENVSAEGLNLTLDEIDEVEEIADCPVSEWQSSRRQGRLLKGMVFVLRRRSDPKAKLEDVGKLPVSELESELAPFAQGNIAAT